MLLSFLFHRVAYGQHHQGRGISRKAQDANKLRKSTSNFVLKGMPALETLSKNSHMAACLTVYVVDFSLLGNAHTFAAIRIRCVHLPTATPFVTIFIIVLKRSATRRVCCS